MKSKRLLVPAAIVALAAVAILGRLDAQEVGPSPAARTAVCSVNRVFLGYGRAADLTAQLETSRQEMAAESQTRKEAAEAMQNELGALKAGSAGYTAKLEQIDQALMEWKVWEEMAKMKLVRRHHALTKEMYNEILAAVRAVAAQQGYALVLTADEVDLTSQSTEQLLAKIAQRKVLYNDSSIDITDAVIQWLNDRYTTPSP